MSKNQECAYLWLPPALYAIKLYTLEYTLLVWSGDALSPEVGCRSA